MAVDASISFPNVLQPLLSGEQTPLPSQNTNIGPASLCSDKADAVVLNLSGQSLRRKLEKHLNDHYSGHGNLSKDMYGMIRNKAFENSSVLGSSNPKALKMYAGYLSAGFSYGIRARFVMGSDEAARGEKKLQNAHSAGSFAIKV